MHKATRTKHDAIQSICTKNLLFQKVVLNAGLERLLFYVIEQFLFLLTDGQLFVKYRSVQCEETVITKSTKSMMGLKSIFFKVTFMKSHLLRNISAIDFEYYCSDKRFLLIHTRLKHRIINYTLSTIMYYLSRNVSLACHVLQFIQ